MRYGKQCQRWRWEANEYVCAEGRLVREASGWRWCPVEGFEAGPWLALADAINAVEALVAEERKAA